MAMDHSLSFLGGNRTGPRGSIKIPLNGSIDLEVTPPMEHGQQSPPLPPPPMVNVIDNSNAVAAAAAVAMGASGGSNSNNDRFVLQYSDSEDSLDFRGTIV